MPTIFRGLSDWRKSRIPDGEGRPALNDAGRRVRIPLAQRLAEVYRLSRTAATLSR